MALITVTGTASVSLDGVDTTESASMSVDVRAILHGTHDTTTSYVVLANTPFVFAYFKNTGSTAIRVRVGSGAGYTFFSIPVGGRLLIPGGSGDDATSIIAHNGIGIRSMTSTGRVLAIIGVNSTN